MHYHIQLLNAISNIVKTILPNDTYTMTDQIDQPDALLVRSAKIHDMSFSPNLRAIARAGAGVNNIPVDRCTEEGIVVFNTPGANANAVKELVLAGMLLSTRNLVSASDWVRTLRGQDQVAAKVEEGKKQFVGHELRGKTIGVIGLGAIGVMVANQGYGLDMNIIGYDPFISVEHAWKLSRAVKHATDLHTMLSQCDFVSIHVPLMEQTKHLIDSAALAAMKPGATLLNFARGELVDTSAVLHTLDQGHLRNYVVDFPNEALLNNPNVICLPHLGASTVESEENCAEMAASQLRDYLENGNIVNSVNFPNCKMPRSGVMRICLINRNTPNMINQFTAFLSEKEVNIANLLNKSRNDYAYTIIDLDQTISSDGIAELSSIKGVIRCTVFQ